MNKSCITHDANSVDHDGNGGRLSVRVNNSVPINNFISARKIMGEHVEWILNFIFLVGWFFCFSLSTMSEKSVLECATRCGQLVNGNLRQTGTTSLLYARHTDSHVYRKGILDARMRPRQFFSYSRRYEVLRSFMKYRTTGVIYEIAYPITLNILRARLYNC